MKRMLFCIALCASVIAYAQIPVPGPSWSRDAIVSWYNNTCRVCGGFTEIPDNSSEFFTPISFFVGQDSVKLVYYFDSIGICNQQDQYWSSLRDTAVILTFVQDTTTLTRLPGQYQWTEPPYAQNTESIVGCRVRWSLFTEYCGVLLVGELEKVE